MRKGTAAASACRGKPPYGQSPPAGQHLQKAEEGLRPHSSCAWMQCNQHIPFVCQNRLGWAWFSVAFNQSILVATIQTFVSICLQFWSPSHQTCLWLRTVNMPRLLKSQPGSHLSWLTYLFDHLFNRDTVSLCAST